MILTKIYNFLTGAQNSLIEIQASIIDSANDLLDHQRKSNDVQRGIINDQKSLIDDLRSLIKDQKILIEDQKSFIEIQKGLIKEQNSSIEPHGFLVMSQDCVECNSSGFVQSYDRDRLELEAQAAAIESQWFAEYEPLDECEKSDIEYDEYNSDIDETIPCPACESTGTKTITINLSEIEDWLKLNLKKCDWWYGYSDCPETRSYAMSHIDLIEQVLSNIPFDDASRLWNEYCPWKTEYSRAS